MEELQQILLQKGISDLDLVEKATNHNSSLVLTNHKEINHDRSCPHYHLSKSLETSYFKDVIDYMKTLKFTIE